MIFKMKKYTFLVKPLFFIFSLLFATWLVLIIEKISPSDFGRHKSLFEGTPKPIVPIKNKQYLKNLFFKYNYGIIDSNELNNKLDFFLDSIHKVSTIKDYKQ
jgi:hypothetical protein